MPRIRTIKPDFWSSEQVVNCSRDARLLFIGTWNFADDNGNLARSAMQLKGRVFPHDEIDCEPLLLELITQGLLHEYSVSGVKYLHIPGFTSHQIINRPSKPNCPIYNDSLRTHGVLTLEGKGMEGNGREVRRASHSAPNGSLKAKQPVLNEATGAIWAAYVSAYDARYGVEPVRNAKVKGIIARYAARLPAGEAAEVAAFYVKHNGQFYVRAKHPVGLLLQDAEGLRTEWKTGATATATTIKCGNCAAPLTGGWSQSPKGRVCDPCHRGYMAEGWPPALNQAVARA